MGIFILLSQSTAIAMTRPPKPRIMPLGDSITWGWTILDQTGERGGYRGYLASYLKGKVDWLGRLHNGPDNAERHEGWSGYQIRRLQQLELANAMAQQPDIVLLMLGTNDAWHPYEYDNQSTRENMLPNITAFLEALYTMQPATKVILSTTTNIWSEGNDAIIAYNAGLPDVVAQLQLEGRQIHLVDSYARVSFAETSVDSDGIHPNAMGYRHIADAFMSDPWLQDVRDPQSLLSSVPEPVASILLLLPVIFARRVRTIS